MKLMSLEQAQEKFEDVAPVLCAIVNQAWKEWLASPYVGLWRTRRSRASFMWEQMVQGALARFADDPRIRALRRNETFLFLLGDSVAFRFKKGDAGGMTCNIPTHEQWLFHDQQQQLPGLPRVSRIDVVYVLNEIETAIVDVLAVGRDRGKVVWKFSLLQESTPIALPTPQPAHAPERDRRPQKPRLRIVGGKGDAPKSDTGTTDGDP